MAEVANGYLNIMKQALVLLALLALAGLSASGNGRTAKAGVANGLVAYSVEFELPGKWTGAGQIETMVGLCAKDIRSGKTWRLTGDPRHDDEWPAWSPDGTQLAFNRNERDGNRYDMVVMDAMGRTRVVEGGGAYPSWSPDGKKFVFADDGIVVMNTDGTGRRQIVEPPRGLGYVEPSPEWSPDGSKIAFVRQESPVPGSGSSIFLVNPDGSEKRKLTDGRDPSWSPDGTRVAFESMPEPGGVHVIGIDGTGRRALRRDGSGPLAWSPDGTLIAFATYKDDLNDVFADVSLIRSDGTGVRPLARTPLLEWAPAWQPRPAGAPLSLLRNRPPCAITGTARKDRLRGTSRDDLAYGYHGADAVRTLAGADMALGGAGPDVLAGGRGPDRLAGGAGSDRIIGGSGSDVIVGGSGDDVVRAADGTRDRIRCGPGVDRIEADALDRVKKDCERVIRR